MNTTLALLDILVVAAIVWHFSRRSFVDGGGATPADLRLRRQVDAIMRHLGLPEPATSSAERLSPPVLELLTEGRTIDAIRLYRQETGEGLKQARDAIERHRTVASA